MNQKTKDAIIRVPEVLETVGISKSTLFRWIKSGAFPEPVKLSPAGAAIGWRTSTIDEYLANLGEN